MEKVNIIFTGIGLVVTLITFILVISGWSYQVMTNNNIIKANLKYEISDNLRKIDIFLEIYDSDIKTTGKLEFRYLEKYRDISKDKNIRDKLAKIMSDIQTYNNGIDLINNNEVDKVYRTITQNSNAELIKSNLEFIRDLI
ncbi:MAG: hypothetical protein V1889_03385 [archaeon]